MKDNWEPKQYEKFKDERSQPFFDLLALVEKFPALDVVDLGCGTAELTKILHDSLKAKSTLGVDNSQKMLEKAKTHGDEKLRFEFMDVQNFLQPASYDIIFSNAALQWCSHHETLLAHLRQSLRPNGQLAVQMPMNHDYPSHTVALMVANESPFKELLASGEPASQSSSLMRPEDYAALLFSLGFKRQQVIMKVYAHVLDSREGVVDWVKGTMLTYYKGKLPAPAYEQFLTRYKEALFKILPDQRPFFYPFKRILLWASLRE